MTRLNIQAPDALRARLARWPGVGLVQHDLGATARGAHGWRSSNERADHVRARMLAEFRDLDRKLKRANMTPDAFDEMVRITAQKFDKALLPVFLEKLKAGETAREAFNAASFEIFGVFGTTY